jgi:endogenous inhibitor of DNA gyrase (YacG/DUF329 family)
MFCPQCGTASIDTHPFCSKCGAAAAPGKYTKESKTIKTSNPSLSRHSKVRDMIGGFFLVSGYILGITTWLLTSYYALINWGIFGALSSFFIPPLDIVFMFMLGTWQLGLPAIVIFIIGSALTNKD